MTTLSAAGSSHAATKKKKGGIPMTTTTGSTHHHKISTASSASSTALSATRMRTGKPPAASTNPETVTQYLTWLRQEEQTAHLALEQQQTDLLSWLQTRCCRTKRPSPANRGSSAQTGKIMEENDKAEDETLVEAAAAMDLTSTSAAAPTSSSPLTKKLKPTTLTAEVETAQGCPPDLLPPSASIKQEPMEKENFTQDHDRRREEEEERATTSSNAAVMIVLDLTQDDDKDHDHQDQLELEESRHRHEDDHHQAKKKKGKKKNKVVKKPAHHRPVPPTTNPLPRSQAQPEEQSSRPQEDGREDDHDGADSNMLLPAQDKYQSQEEVEDDDHPAMNVDPLAPSAVLDLELSPENDQKNSDPMNNKLPSPPRSRSPVRRMVQAGVQNAIKLLSPLTNRSVAPAPEPGSISGISNYPDPHKKTKYPHPSHQQHHDQKKKSQAATMVLDEEDDGDNDEQPLLMMSSQKENQTNRMMMTMMEELEVAPATMSHPSTGGIKPATLATPAASSSTRAMTSSSTMDSIKAKNQARLAKLAEIRSKSKPVATTTTTQLPTNYAGSSISTSLSTTSKLLASTTNKSTNQEEQDQRKRLAAQMRAKAAANRQPPSATADSKAAPTTLASSSSSSTSSRHVHPQADPSHQVHLVGAKSPSQPHVPSTKPAQKEPAKDSIPPLSPMDTYEMSEHEGSDSDMSDEESEHNKPKKHIPAWAQKANLISALERQYSKGALDPDEIFGEVQTCDLEAIFAKKKKRYMRRTSSGNWKQDQVTTQEKLAYKRAMKYTEWAK